MPACPEPCGHPQLLRVAASALISGGASVKQVRTFLGHASAVLEPTADTTGSLDYRNWVRTVVGDSGMSDTFEVVEYGAVVVGSVGAHPGDDVSESGSLCRCRRFQSGATPV